MQIRNNLSGLNTLRKLNKQNKRLEKTTSRLSSGLRISSAADDAAGLSISEKMRSQIRGLRIQNNDLYRENLTAAELRIRDADMAEEAMEHVKASMLQQTSTAMMSHAQLIPQAVLQLLG